MSRILLAFALLILSQSGIAQKKKSNSGKTTAPLVDSIAFHLYTDSLKKGVHNYINVDGLVAGKNWYPLSSEDIRFESDEGRFEGNSLVLPVDFSKEKVTIAATYKRNPNLRKEITIYIKKLEEGPLKSKDEIMDEIRRGGSSRKIANQVLAICPLTPPYVPFGIRRFLKEVFVQPDTYPLT